MIIITVKHFYNRILVFYHSFTFIMNTNDIVLTHIGVYWPLNNTFQYSSN